MKKRYFNIQHNSHKKQFCTKAVLAGIFSVLVFFSSCSNAFLDGGSSSGVKTGTVTGSIDFGGALPKEILDQLNSSSNNSGPQGERTAFPSISQVTNPDKVEVYAQIGNETTTKITAKNVTTKSYELGGLEFGKEYTITANFKNVSGNIIMQGSVKVTLSDDEPVVNKNISVAPTQTNGGKGIISLSFSFTGDVGWNSNNVACFYVFDNDSEKPMDDPVEKKFTFRPDPISSGAHSVKFIFKRKGTNYILYQFTETINVFDNLTTNTWVKNGNEPYLKSSYCEITKACVDQFTQTVFYVGGRDNNGKPANDSNSGTWFYPLATIDKAFDKISNSASAGPFTIHIADGEYDFFGNPIGYGLTAKHSVSIEGSSNTTIQDYCPNSFLSFDDAAADNNACISVKNINYIFNSDKETSGFFFNWGYGTSSKDRKIILENVKFSCSDSLGSLSMPWLINIINEQLQLKDCTFDSIGFEFSDEEVSSGLIIHIDGDYSQSSIENTEFSNIRINKTNNENLEGGIIRNAGKLDIKQTDFWNISVDAIPSDEECEVWGGLIYSNKEINLDTVNFGKKGSVIFNLSDHDIYGGLLYNNGKVTCKNCIFTNTSFDFTYADGLFFGGALLNASECTLENCKVYGISLNSNGDDVDIRGLGACQKPSPTSDLKLTLKGSTWFALNAEIALDYSDSNNTYGLIEVADENLTPIDSYGQSVQTVAQIKSMYPYPDLTGVKVLTDSVSGRYVDKNKSKFLVSPPEGAEWFINSEGKLFSPIGTKAPGDYAVGDIVFNDGSATPYSLIQGSGLTDAEKNAAIAVIFRVGDGTEGNKTLGVGIKKSAEKIVWCSFSANGYNMKFNTNSIQDGSNILHIMTQQLSDSLSDDDTRISWNADGTIDFTYSEQTELNNKYPAFEFAYYYGKNDGHNTQGTGFENGWYLPTMYELNDIYSIKETIDNALDVAGGDEFGTSAIWSSNQDVNSGEEKQARAFNFGATSSSDKNYFRDKDVLIGDTYARAIRAFN